MKRRMEVAIISQNEQCLEDVTLSEIFEVENELLSSKSTGNYRYAA